MARLPFSIIVAAVAVAFASRSFADQSARDVEVDSDPSVFRLPQLPPLPNLEAFSSSGVSPAGPHTSYGFKWAFADTISEPAWLLTGTIGSGSSPTATSEMGRSIAFDVTVRVMAGRQQNLGRLYAALFVGPETRMKIDLSQEKPARRFYGLRAEGHLWYRPSDDTVYGWVLSVGTIDPDLWSRTRAGLRVFDVAVIGPEATLAAGSGRSEMRLGVFVAEMKLLGRTFDAGFGAMRDTEDRSGWYGTLAHTTRF